MEETLWLAIWIIMSEYDIRSCITWFLESYMNIFAKRFQYIWISKIHNQFEVVDAKLTALSCTVS